MSKITQESADSIEDIARRIHDVAQYMRDPEVSTTSAHSAIVQCRVALQGVMREMMSKYWTKEVPEREQSKD